MSRKWIEWEIQYLEKSYYKYGAEHIAKKLNRTIESVRKKAQSIKLNSYTGDKIHSKTMAKCFNVDDKVIRRWFQNGLKYQLVKRGQLTFYLIDTQDFWNWAEQHKEMIPWEKYDDSLSLRPEWVKYYKLPQTPKKHRKPISLDERYLIQQMYNHGKTTKELAEYFGRTDYSIKHILNQNMLSIRINGKII